MRTQQQMPNDFGYSATVFDCYLFDYFCVVVGEQLGRTCVYVCVCVFACFATIERKMLLKRPILAERERQQRDHRPKLKLGNGKTIANAHS